jgi:Sec-independent protein translocase protein TatA
MELKDNWKKVGKGFGELGKDLGELGKDLGVSIVKSVKKGAEKVSEWADNEDKKEESKADVVVEPEQKEE